jgi:hypothetical protein
MENLRLRQAPSTSVNVTVGKRSRDYLTDREVERLIEAAKQNALGIGTPRRSWSLIPPRPQGRGAGGTALGRQAIFNNVQTERFDLYQWKPWASR